MGGSGEIMTGCGWWQQNYGWLQMVVGCGSRIMAGCGLWQENHGWSSWVIVGGGDKFMADCRLLWVVTQFSKFLTSQLADSMDFLVPSTFAPL